MKKNEKSELITALKNGTVQVTFKKVNSEEIRVMPCTLNPLILEAHNVAPTVGSINPDSDIIACWSLDKTAWRSFIAETVISWEVL